jgi:hypothetical protein
MNFDELWGEVRAESTGRVVRGEAPPGRRGDAGAAGQAAPPGPDVLNGMTEQAVEEAREAVLERIAHFRSSVVLVPLDSEGGLWTTDLGGISWICAFSDDAALARFAEARADASREWTYRKVLGSRLLDEVVPAVDFPCGVALDAGSAGGTLFPPVTGIVPDAAAVDNSAYGEGEA